MRASLYDRKPMATAEEVRALILTKARKRARAVGAPVRTLPATEKQLGLMNGLLAKCFPATDSDAARHQFLEYVFGHPSSKGLSMDEAGAMIDWLKDPHGPGPHPAAVAEAWVVLARVKQIDDEIDGRVLDDLWDGCQPDCMP